MRAASLAVLMGLLLVVGGRGEDSPAAEPAPWDQRAVRLPPFLWYESDPEWDRRFLMVSLLYWDLSQARTGQRLLLPVFYQWWEEDRQLLVSLPLIVSYRNPLEQWFLAGPYFRSRNPAHTRTILFPIYWQKIRPGAGKVTSALPFVFYDYRSGDRSRVDQAFLGGYRRKRGPSTSGFVLNYGWSNTPESRFRTLFPVYWHRRSAQEAFDVWGLVYRKKTEASLEAGGSRYALGLFPLVGGGGTASGAIRSHYVFPFYFADVHPGGHSLVTLPASRFVEGDQRSGHVALYFYGRSSSRRVDGIFPLYFGEKTEKGEETQFLLPFYWRSRHPDRWSLDLLFPLYAHYRDPDLTWTAGLPFLHARSKEGETWSLFYLYWHAERLGRELDLLFPLAYFDRSPGEWNFISPFYWSRQGKRSREGAWPLGYWYASPEKGRQFAFPLYLHERLGDQRFTMVVPYYRSKRPDGTALGVFPLWGRFWSENTRGSYLTPFYFAKEGRTPQGEVSSYFNYLFLGSVSQQGSSLSQQFYPLFRYDQSEGFENFWAPRMVPLLGWKTTPTERDRLLFPVAWRRGPERDWDVLFPLWHGERRYEVTAGSAPLRGQQTSSTQMLFPIYWRGKNPQRSYTTVLPFYADFREAAHRFQMVPPLWWAVDTKGGGAFRLLFPVYWRVETSPQPNRPTEKVRVYGLYYRATSKREGGVTRTVGVAPFYSTTSGSLGERGFELLGGLFAREVKGGQRRFRWAWILTTAPKPLAPGPAVR